MRAEISAGDQGWGNTGCSTVHIALLDAECSQVLATQSLSAVVHEVKQFQINLQAGPAGTLLIGDVLAEPQNRLALLIVSAGYSHCGQRYSCVGHSGSIAVIFDDSDGV